MVVVGAEATAPRSDDGRHDTTDDAERALQLADVVQQRTGDLGCRRCRPDRDEPPGHENRMPLVGRPEPGPQRELGGVEVLVDPCLVIDGRRSA